MSWLFHSFVGLNSVNERKMTGDWEYVVNGILLWTVWLIKLYATFLE